MRKAHITRRSLLGSVGAVSVGSTLMAQGQSGDVATSLADTGLEPLARAAFRAQLRIGPQQPATGMPLHFWAAVQGGEISGPVLAGQVQSGRIDWHVDAASQSVQITARFAVLRTDGQLVEVRDRAVYPATAAPAAMGGICTAPELICAGEEMPAEPRLLVGRLDATGFGQGVIRLQAFEVS